MQKIEKRYSAKDYIKSNQLRRMPYTLSEIFEYALHFGETPFKCVNEENWAYEYLVELQRKKGVFNDQFFTPPSLCEKFFKVAESSVYIGKGDYILDLCCGFGGLSKVFRKNGFYNIYGIDIDNEQGFDIICQSHGINYNQSDLSDIDIFSFMNANIIISNPPYKNSFYPTFFDKAYHLLDDCGDMFVILPTSFFETLKDKSVKKSLERWAWSKRCDSNIEFERTKICTSIFHFSKEI